MSERLYCAPQGRATDEWLLRCIMRTLDEMRSRIDAIEAVVINNNSYDKIQHNHTGNRGNRQDDHDS